MSSSGTALTDDEGSLFFADTETSVAESAVAAFPPKFDTHATQRNGVNLGPAAIHFVLVDPLFVAFSTARILGATGSAASAGGTMPPTIGNFP